MSKEESVGRGFQKVIHHEDLPVLMANWEKHTRDVTECEVEVRYRRKDGILNGCCLEFVR